MNSNAIPFNYFYRECSQKYQKIVLERQAQLLKDGIKSYYVYLIEEKMPMMEKAIMEVCIDYIRICDLGIELLPKNVFELLLFILEQSKPTTYQQSFLFSIDLICADYLEMIGAGRPVLSSSNKKSDEKYCEVTLNKENKIMDLTTINLNPLEETKIIVKMCMLIKNKEQGPLPLVKYRKRNDV